MDSLLASYGSDDEEDEGKQETSQAFSQCSDKLDAPSEPVIKRSILGALPPPRNPQKSMPPRHKSLDALTSHRRVGAAPADAVDVTGMDSAGGMKRLGSLFASLPQPQNSCPTVLSPILSGESCRHLNNVPKTDGESDTLKGSSFDDSSSVVSSGGVTNSLAFGQSLPERSGKVGASLFRSLPPPKTQSGGGIQPSQKQKVTFRPPINMALLESKDDDDWEPSKKLAKPESSTTKGKGEIGLAALLPAPKNSLGVGVSLGSGASQGGRRTTMETSSELVVDRDPEPIGEGEVSNVRAPQSFSTFIESESGASLATDARNRESLYPPPYQGSPATFQDAYTKEQQWPSGGGYTTDQADLTMYHVGGQYDANSWQYQGGGVGYSTQPTQALPNMPTVAHALQEPDDPIALVLKAERRRGREEKMPLNVIEVKQADLTGPKLREDELHTTGIAFGPSYQPVASNKDKPSKLQRRKHQIGSLYFDMRQKEMELVERRSKGLMTKAETQAKYGW